MPNLPTLTVTQAQADRMLAVFGSTAAYKEWLKNSIVDYVLATEYVARRTQFETDEAAKAAQGKTDLTTGVV